MKVTQVLALFAVLAVTVSACGDKNKHPHDPQDSEPEVPAPDVPTPDVPAPQNPIPQDPQGSVSGSKTQHQEANNNGAEITNSEGLAVSIIIIITISIVHLISI